MSTIDGRYWIIYNGEIFNYIELKEKLLKRGVKFRTTSDTEVLLNLYAIHGESCLQQLNLHSASEWRRRPKKPTLCREPALQV